MHSIRNGFISLLCAGGLLTPAWALKKCTSSDGKVTYTDGACAPQDKSKPLDIVVTPPSDLQQARDINTKVKDALRAIEEGKRPRGEEGGAVKNMEKAPEKTPSTATSPDTAPDDDTRRRAKPR